MTLIKETVNNSITWRIKILRKRGVDLCKLIALLFVFFIHYIGWAGFFEDVQNQIIYYCVMMVLAQVVIACVPLFFIITGYLSNSVKFGNNYKKIINVFNIYIFYAVVLILVTIYEFKSVYSIKSVLCNLLGIHSIINREWYISVYILLLLFLPFLNQLWQILSRDMKRHLLFLLLITTSLTQSIHVVWNIDFFNLEFASKMYVVLYFFIGKYIADYGIQIRKRFLCMIFVSAIIFSAFYFGIAYYGKIVDASRVIQYGRLGTVLISVSLFGLLYDVNLKDKWHLLIKFGARASLDTYLGALSLEYLLFHTDLKGTDFLKRNFLYLILIIFITIFFGNLRQMISKHILEKGGGKTQYINLARNNNNFANLHVMYINLFCNV